MSITGSEQWMYSSGREFYEFPIEQSLRFNDNDTAYLSRTNSSSPTDNKKGTLSVWLKRGHIGDRQYIIETGTGASNDTHFNLHLSTANQLNCGMYSVSPFATSQVFRDISAWFHLCFSFDSAQAVASDRRKLYINGVQVTDFASNTDIPLNTNWAILNSGQVINIGRHTSVNDTWDGYMAEFNLIDGQALDPTSFGETKSGIWIPKEYSGSYGTNGFRLNFADTVEASGFNALTWTGTGQSQALSGLGFSPDLVWIKGRSNATNHYLFDTLRGVNNQLLSNATSAEAIISTDRMTAFNPDGFEVGAFTETNGSGRTFVSWCWDAGSGSPVSNTDGSITSTVKANTDYGFSIASYTGNATAGATVGHGLNTQPSMIITKARGAVSNWFVYHSANTAEPETEYLTLETTNATTDNSTTWNDTAPTSSVFSIGQSGWNNTSGVDYIAYCFAEKSGYSKFGTYTGTGAAGNSITGLGFKPAFLLAKRTDSTGNWGMWDNTRDTEGTVTKYLIADLSNAEGDASSVGVDFDDDGFTFQGGSALGNASGGTYIYMAFADTRDAAFWRDVSGQGNDWQHNNLTFSDVVPDSATNNFCTMNILDDNYSTPKFTYSEGNLKYTYGYSGAGFDRVFGSIAISPSDTNKYYFEFTGNVTNEQMQWGVVSTDSLAYSVADRDNGLSATANASQLRWVSYLSAPYLYRIDSSTTSEGTLLSTSNGNAANGDIYSLVYDADAGKFYAWFNGVEFTGQDYAAGTSLWTTMDTSKTYMVMMYQGDGGVTSKSGNMTANFGADSSFAGAKTRQGNTDANGLGDFYYPVPEGALALCSANLPSGAIDTLADETPEDYFNTVLWTGDATNPRTLTGVGFEPSFSWLKSRSQAFSHRLYDAVRGAGNVLFSNATSAESSGDAGGELSAFTSDGFTTSGSSNNNNLNGSGYTYAAWNWKANGAGVSNTDGSITSTVSAAETSQGDKWFSVVKWTGNGTAGATVGHGLTSQPRLIITKNMDAGGTEWSTLAQDANSGSGHLGYMRLNSTAAWSSTSILWNNTEPTSSVFTLGSYNYVNASGQDIIAYCFANAEGLCKVGSYTGNGSADGPMIVTGFRPAFLLIKRTDAADNWDMHDSVRGSYNVNDWRLYANQSSAEASGGAFGADFLSNGFKLRTSNAGWNASGGSYIFLAIAEQPFKYANAR